MSGLDPQAPVTIRAARPLDVPLLRELAELDSATLPAGELLVAVLDGSIVAAVSVSDGRAVADPFRPTADLVDLLRSRARQLRHSQKAAHARTPHHRGRRLLGVLRAG